MRGDLGRPRRQDQVAAVTYPSGQTFGIVIVDTREARTKYQGISRLQGNLHPVQRRDRLHRHMQLFKRALQRKEAVVTRFAMGRLVGVYFLALVRTEEPQRAQADYGNRNKHEGDNGTIHATRSACAGQPINRASTSWSLGKRSAYAAYCQVRTMATARWRCSSLSNARARRKHSASVASSGTPLWDAAATCSTQPRYSRASASRRFPPRHNMRVTPARSSGSGFSADSSVTLVCSFSLGLPFVLVRTRRCRAANIASMTTATASSDHSRILMPPAKKLPVIAVPVLTVSCLG